MKKQQVFYSILPQYRDSLDRCQASGDQAALTALQQCIMDEVEKVAAEGEQYMIPEALREVYKTIGGTPHLDTNYTVFGEVVEGMEVIDKIAAVERDENNRPLEDIRMVVELVK